VKHKSGKWQRKTDENTYSKKNQKKEEAIID
jgi:hypothetical protein